MTPIRSSSTRLGGGIEQFLFMLDGGSLDNGRYGHFGAGRGTRGRQGEQRQLLVFQQDMQAAITIPL